MTKPQIYADSERVKEFEKKFPVENWRAELNKKIAYYQKNPFSPKRLNIFLETIKKSIFLYNNAGEPYPSKKSAQIPTNSEADILTDPQLLERINKEFDKKIVGEVESRITIFMVANMRNVENLNKATDNLMVNAVSGTGKDYITECIFDILPSDEKEELVRTSPKVLAYTRNSLIEPTSTWRKCSLRLEDVGNNVLNDDAFKVFSSANPNKINFSKIVNKGKIIEIGIDGKPPIIMTTAQSTPREEQLRRFPILYLDEGIDQTKEIIRRQAEYAIKGKSVDYDDEITNALSKLKRIKVKIPFADILTKIFCPENVIVRTHFPRFLDYIKSSTSLFQYQRQTDEQDFYIAQKEDYEIARKMLIKTTSNILMIPLTKLQKCILELFEKENLQRKSTDEIENYQEIKELNISQEWLRKQLDFLVSKRFLKKDRERRMNEAGKIIPKPIFVYTYNLLQKLEIPTWDELMKISSNTQVNEVNEVNDLKTDKNKNEKKDKFSKKSSSNAQNSKISSNTSNTSNTKSTTSTTTQEKVEMVEIVDKKELGDENDDFSEIDFSKSGIKEALENG